MEPILPVLFQFRFQGNLSSNSSRNKPSYSRNKSAPARLSAVKLHHYRRQVDQIRKLTEQYDISAQGTKYRESLRTKETGKVQRDSVMSRYKRSKSTTSSDHQRKRKQEDSFYHTDNDFADIVITTGTHHQQLAPEEAPPGPPQPMTLLDYSTVKVINMPSLAQGQFKESPLQIFRSSNSSVSRSRECYHSASGAKIKRKIKSLTECKFMPSNISLSHKPDTLIWASSDPKKSYFRVLTEDLSIKKMEIDSDDMKLLKQVKRAKELNKSPMLDPKILKPCAHWYEINSKDFHVQAHRHNEHIRMLCT